MSELSEYRAAKDRFFGSDPNSPLTPAQRRRFRGLSYYTENPALRLTLPLEELPDAEKELVEMETSTGESHPQVRWGRFHFEVDGQAATLYVYHDEMGGEYFMPFADATSGRETYGAGRYLDVPELGDGWFQVDFNYAYNPYCAYNSRWSCPIPPPENRLKVPIRAGEKTFTDAEGQ